MGRTLIVLTKLKEFIADLNGGFVKKQLKYSISMLTILIESVDRIVNDH